MPIDPPTTNEPTFLEEAIALTAKIKAQVPNESLAFLSNATVNLEIVIDLLARREKYLAGEG